MSVTASVVKQGEKCPPIAAREAVWVFESNTEGRHERGAPMVAVKCHGAEQANSSGRMGNSYAITTRDGDNNLLDWALIKDSIGKFRDYTAAHPDLRFRILPSLHNKTEQEHVRFIDLLRNVPSNCDLPGRMLERLERLDGVRIILLDTNVTLAETQREQVLDQYFAANAGLWNVGYIEIVSLGTAQSLVANDNYAKARGYRHRIIRADPDLYGAYTDQARDHLSVAYATKLVCINDPTGTSTGNQVGALHLANCTALQIDELLIQ
jgi:hypothetical protein